VCDADSENGSEIHLKKRAQEGKSKRDGKSKRERERLKKNETASE